MGFEGRKHSKKSKKKMSDSHKKFRHSEGTKRKMSKLYKGTGNPFFGKHHSKTTRKKISNAIKGENHPLYGKIGILNPRYGKKNTPDTIKRMSNIKKGKNNPFFGKHHSIEHCRKLSEKETGVGNPNWQGGLSFEDYGIEFNEKLKKNIRERDKVCQLCGMLNCKDVHHIDYNKKNNKQNNLILLCRGCHLKTNFNREYWKEHFGVKE